MKLYKKIICGIIAMISLFSVSLMVYAVAEYSYGDESGLVGLEQFDGEKYAIYKNGDTGNTELAVVYADDIDDRSIMIEKKEQIDVKGNYPYSYDSKVTEYDIDEITRPKLYMADTKCLPQTVEEPEFASSKNRVLLHM